MKIWTFLTAISVATVVITAADTSSARHNIVVQSYKDVMQNSMFEPGFNPAGYDARIKAEAKQKETDSVIAVSDGTETPKDYNKEMAESLFAAPDLSPLIFEVIEKHNFVKVNLGQPLQVILPENTAAKWFYDKKFKHLEIIEDYSFQGQRIVNIEVKTKGKEKIYFDLIDDSGSSIKVIESRVLNITVN